MLSLRRKGESRRLVMEILEEDPTNSAALGLLEILDPQISAKKTSSTQDLKSAKSSARKHETSSLASPDLFEKPFSGHKIKGAQVKTEEIDPQFASLLNSPARPAGAVSSPPLIKAATPSTPNSNTLRERTISALAALFHDKGKTIKGWRDPRFTSISADEIRPPSPPPGLKEPPLPGKSALKEMNPSPAKRSSFSSMAAPSLFVSFRKKIANLMFKLPGKKKPAFIRQATPEPRQNTTPENSSKILWFYLLMGLVMIVALYGFWAEPYWIQISRYQLQTGVDPPFKIAHLTDLHTYGLGSREQEVLQILDAEKPDLIAITGDTLSSSGNYELCRPFLSSLHAPSGIWMVPGNFENRRKLDNASAFYNSLNVHYLVNRNQPIRPNLYIVGLDDASSGFPDLDAALAFVPQQAKTLVLMHSPSYFRHAAGRCDLILAGHSHGGQIRLPLVGGLWRPEGVEEYSEGWFEKEKTKMYVSRGLGTVFLDIRLFCRPELVFITMN